MGISLSNEFALKAYREEVCGCSLKVQHLN